MPHLLLLIYVHTITVAYGAADHLTAEHVSELPPGADRGQATTEYALVLLAAAMVALLVIAWASAGGGAARISQLFNRVIDAVISRV